MKTPTLEEIQSLRQTIDNATTPKKDLTALNQAIDSAIARKDFDYAFGLAAGSSLSRLGLSAQEHAEAYLRINGAKAADLKAALDTAIPPQYSFLEHDYVESN